MPDIAISGYSELTAGNVALDDLLEIVDVSDTSGSANGTNRKVLLRSLLSRLASGLCDFRLTTESGVSVSTADRTAQSTLYLTPHQGRRIGLYDPTNTLWVPWISAEISLTLSGLTTAKNYDCFAYVNSGAVTYDLGPAWTSDTTRGTGAGTTELESFEGANVNKVTVTGLIRGHTIAARAGRYVGSIRTTGTTTTEDSGFGSTTSSPKRFVWNAQNRVSRPLFIEEDTASWTYTGSTTWRQARAQADNQVEVLVGMAGMSRVHLIVSGPVTNGTAANGSVYGIGRDATNALAANQVNYYMGVSGTGVVAPASAALAEAVPLGYHYYPWLETITGSSTTGTFFGTATGSRRVGLVGSVEA